MVALIYEREKLVHSVARLIAGLETFYYRKYKKFYKRIERLFVDGKSCPFCSRIFKKKSGLVTHIVRYHYDDVIDFVFSDTDREQ